MNKHIHYNQLIYTSDSKSEWRTDMHMYVCMSPFARIIGVAVNLTLNKVPFMADLRHYQIFYGSQYILKTPFMCKYVHI